MNISDPQVAHEMMQAWQEIDTRDCSEETQAFWDKVRAHVKNDGYLVVYVRYNEAIQGNQLVLIIVCQGEEFVFMVQGWRDRIACFRRVGRNLIFASPENGEFPLPPDYVKEAYVEEARALLNKHCENQTA